MGRKKSIESILGFTKKQLADLEKSLQEEEERDPKLKRAREEIDRAELELMIMYIVES